MARSSQQLASDWIHDIAKGITYHQSAYPESVVQTLTRSAYPSLHGLGHAKELANRGPCPGASIAFFDTTSRRSSASSIPHGSIGTTRGQTDTKIIHNSRRDQGHSCCTGGKANALFLESTHHPPCGVKSKSAPARQSNGMHARRQVQRTQRVDLSRARG
jgi:hypothetical protein